MIDLSNKSAYKSEQIDAAVRHIFPAHIIAALDAIPKDPSNQQLVGVERIVSLIVSANEAGYNNGILTMQVMLKDLLGLDKWYRT